MIKHHIYSLVKSSITAIRNVKTAELAPVNGCECWPWAKLPALGQFSSWEGSAKARSDFSQARVERG